MPFLLEEIWDDHLNEVSVVGIDGMWLDSDNAGFPRFRKLFPGPQLVPHSVETKSYLSLA